MALTAEEERILAFAKAAMPAWFTSDARAQEFLGMAAAIMGDAKIQIDHWMLQTLILSSVGPVGAEPDWLELHAQDRGTSRQLAESDAALRGRIRSSPDSLTRTIILDAVQDVLDAEAIAGTPVMVELPRDKAFFRTAASDTNTGGTFTAPGAGDVMTFAADVVAPFAVRPYRHPGVEERVDTKLVISGAASAGNDGTFPITGLSGDAVTYVNASGVAGFDATATWTVQKFDRNGNLLDGFQDSFFTHAVAPSDASYMDRMFAIPPSTILIILPDGCTAGTLASVEEAMRQKKGAGVGVVVECRENP